VPGPYTTFTPENDNPEIYFKIINNGAGIAHVTSIKVTDNKTGKTYVDLFPLLHETGIDYAFLFGNNIADHYLKPGDQMGIIYTKPALVLARGAEKWVPQMNEIAKRLQSFEFIVNYESIYKEKFTETWPNSTVPHKE